MKELYPTEGSRQRLNEMSNPNYNRDSAHEGADKLKERVITLALEAGFSRARIHGPAYGVRSLLVCAFPTGLNGGQRAEKGFAEIAFFARFNFYREAVTRLKKIAAALRASSCSGRGGEANRTVHPDANKSSYRIFCNSRINEKQLALECGLGLLGRHNLIITPEAGSLVAIASMTLPFDLPRDPPLGDKYAFCAACPEDTPCALSCPTGALSGQGELTLTRCIQWYASGHGGADVPEEIREHWGRRLYGCEECQRFCPRNRQDGALLNGGAVCAEGKSGLEQFVDIDAFLNLSSAQIKLKFKRSALGFSWLNAETLRRSAKLSR